jgi:cytochrome P450
MRERRNDPIGLYTRAMREHGPIVRFRMRFFSLILPTEPQYLEHVLLTNAENYSKGVLWRKMESLIGKGLITSEGEQWRRQRKMVQPVFDRQRWPKIVSMLHREVAKQLEAWRRRRSEPLDLEHEMTLLTMNSICISLFGERALPRIEGLARAGMAFADEVSAEVLAAFHPLSFLRRKHAGQGPGTRNLRRIISELVAEMRTASHGEDELVSLLLAARDEDGRPMTDEELLDEVLLLITAGFETTAMALTWTFFLIAQDARVQKKLREEVRGTLGTRAPTFEDLAGLPYVKAVIEESMRLYPPAWSFPRQAIEDDEIDGYPIPKGSIIAVCSYVMHRHPKYWDRPDDFFPERWEDDKKRPRLTYFPFGAGMRQCSGNRLAMVQMPIVVAQVMQAFELQLEPGPPVTPKALITLRPGRPIFARVTSEVP